MSDFETELKTGFLEEATQLLGDSEQCFLSLEANPDDPSLVEKIFRLAHNLKGSSKAVGFDELGKFTHTFESFLLKIKNKEIPVVPETVSLLLNCNDHIRFIVDGLRADMTARFDSSELAGILEAYLSGEKKVGEVAPPQVEIIETPVVQTSEQDEIDRMLSMPFEVPAADNVVAFAAPTASVAAPVVAPAETPVKSVPAKAAGGPEDSIRVSLTRLEKLMNFVGEMVILQTVLREQAALLEHSDLVRKTVHQLGKVTKDVQDLSMSLRMLPVKPTFQKLQRIVRDTSGILGKKVDLVMVGEDAELDKTVLDHLGDPLVHIVRNAVDHGIETPETRLAAGKAPVGNLLLKAFQEGDKFVIEIIDDGAGIDANRLRQKATEKGILRAGQVISDQEAIHLIFHAGFSTKTEVSEVSGRGVGMDVVRTNIEQLGGQVFIETKLGQGSTFRIVLPLTLAIIDAMIVKISDDRFVVPLNHVSETLRPGAKDLHKTTTLGEVLLLRGENLPVFRLRSLLGRKVVANETCDEIALVIRSGKSAGFAVLVDDVVGQHQVVVKKLGEEIRNLPGLSGSAILGDGKPSLILELSELVQKGARQTSSHSQGRKAA